MACCMAAIDELWIATHGAPKEFITDGESGIARSEQCKRFLARKGVSLHVRGKDQHARFIERWAHFSEIAFTASKAN